MQAKSMELEASLVTATGALQQLSTQQAVHSAPKPPKPPKPDKFQGDRKGAASNWLHQMTLYLTLSDSWAPHRPCPTPCPSSLELQEPGGAPKKLPEAHQPPGQHSRLPSLGPSRPLMLSASPETTWRTSRSHQASVTSSSETSRASAATNLGTVLESALRQPPCVQQHPQHKSTPETSRPT